MRTIKRYANRKLYDPQGRRYITLQQIAQLVAKGDAVKVQDRDTGSDLTGQTLLQAMMEWEKAKAGAFAVASLGTLIRAAARKNRKKR